MFPGEDEFLSQVSLELSDCLELGFATVNLGVNMITHRNPTEDPCQSPAAYRVGHALCIRACKLLRTSLKLATIGANTELTILLRSSFETLVAAHFVLLPTLTLCPLGKKTSCLTSNDRAEIYLGYQTVTRFNGLLKQQKDPLATQELRRIDTSKMQADVAEIETTIGTNWILQFKKQPYTYSGMNLKTLTETIGSPCDEYYRKLYGLQSKSVHSTDINAHVSFSNDQQRLLAKWYPEARSLKNEIISAIVMAYACLKLLNDKYRFNGNTEVELELCLNALGSLSN